MSREDCLIQVVLHGDAAGDARVPGQQRDREQATRDLCTDSHFAPVDLTGPFILHLSVDGGRLVLDVRTEADEPVRIFVLALSPLRHLIRDYRLLVESYDGAMADGHAARVQTIDMGRRALHNEGAELLTERLAGKIDIDFDTARRLFTLVCVLWHRI